jgi:uncharacterized protein (TIGR03083 family)
MTLPREEVLAGLQDELAAFEELVRSLDADQWRRPTRCTGWTTGDVAAHVAGTMADVAALRLEGLGTPEVTEREVAERRGRAPAEIADELAQVAKLTADLAAGFDDTAWDAPAPGGLAMTLGEGVEALWYDAYLHGLDIRDAIGSPPVRGAGLRASVSHVTDVLTRQGWGPATVALDGMEEVGVSGGGARRIGGDPLHFVLTATGRADPTELGLDETVNIYR